MTVFTLSDIVTRWVVSPFGTLVALLLSVAYAAGLVALRRSGEHVPVLRPLVFYVVGIGSLVLATDGGLAAARSTSFVAAAAQSAVLAAITPIGIALGDPLGLARRALGPGATRGLDRVVGSRVARVVFFPLVGSVVATALHLLVFTTGWLAASVASAWVRELTYAVLLVSGLVFVLPLLGEALVPTWCTAGVRVLIAFGDGLLDAVPGVVVMASPSLLGAPVAAYLAAPDPLWQQRLGGGAMFGIAEVVGLPLLAATVAVWVRSDAREAALVDARLDLEEESDRPWWETDPRFTRRAP
ncbi:putative copper resistance protein D [Phycicoccus badiiscoriae]|uniref:Putative copper resistance protein D n=1 Tax=Pedococcus badiiscoriae TaxID=642776 RepID=A0A852WM72_9MICO|nr:cytochrome c oxidase assembly protein [Pedococcus badiiscoriae]NYG08681.1 putative copper resistance protein D [Pedococcus badiiscoriae]